MKRFVLPFLIVTLLFSSCKTDKKEEKNDDLVLEQEEVVDEIPNLSDINFIAALQEYQKGDYNKAATLIHDGVNELKKEGTNLDTDNKKVLNESITKINTLIENVKKGNQDLVVLTQAFGNAEMQVAHDYFTYTVSTLLKEPTKGTYFFSKALRSIDNAAVTLKGDAKNDAKAIQSDSRALAKKVKDGAKDVENEIKTQTEKINNFLKKHKVDIF